MKSMGQQQDNIVDTTEELARLRRENELFRQEHRIIGGSLSLIFLGPQLVVAIRNFLRVYRQEGSAGLNEVADLAAAIVRRVLSVGLVGLFFASILPAGLLFWQNILIAAQNQYFQEQNRELRRQIQQEQDNTQEARRAEVLATLYDRKPCAEPGQVGIDPEDGLPGFFAIEAHDVLENEWLAKSDITPRPIDCAASNIRARSEAARVFVEIAWREIGEEGRSLPCGESSMIPDLTRVVLDRAVLSTGNWNCSVFRDAQLNGVDFRGSSAHGVYMSGAWLRGAYLSGSDLTGCFISGSNMRGAKLVDAKLTRCKIVGSLLVGASFDRAVLDGVDLDGSWLDKASFNDADLRGVDLSSVRGLTAAQLEEACLDEETRLPLELDSIEKNCPAGSRWQ